MSPSLYWLCVAYIDLACKQLLVAKVAVVFCKQIHVGFQETLQFRYLVTGQAFLVDFEFDGLLFVYFFLTW